MDKTDLDALRSDFLRHEAICEERWKTVFNEIRDAKEQGDARWTEVRASFESAQRMLFAGSGALILFLLAVIFGDLL